MLKWNETSKNLKPLKESFYFDFKWFLPAFNKILNTWKKFWIFDVDFKWFLPDFNNCLVVRKKFRKIDVSVNDFKQFYASQWSFKLTTSTINDFSLPSIKVVDTWKMLRIIDVDGKFDITILEKPIKEAFYFYYNRLLSSWVKFS